MAVIIPVLDLSLTDKNFQETSALLVRHLSDIGFVYLSGHGIANNVIESCRKSSRAFFNSTEEEKLKFSFKSIEENNGYNGYIAFESERANPKVNFRIG
jgi:isopenicillin N synthase-like dioxygenase